MLRRGQQEPIQAFAPPTPPEVITIIERVGDPSNGVGPEFLSKTIEQLGHVVVGEPEAKLGYIAAMVVGTNFVAFGPSGTGKTQLLHYGPRLIEGLGDHSIKFLPPQSDLTGKEVSGGTVLTSKTTTENGVVRNEENSTTIDPILHPEVEIITGDEINRASPLALAAMFEALESGRVVNNMGERELKKLQFAAFAFNPRGLDRTVYPMSSAFISRLPIGVVMGVNPDDTSDIIDAALDKKMSQPENMVPVTNFQEVKHIRALAEGMRVNQHLKNRASALIKSTNDVLQVAGIREGHGRMAGQIVKVASALAVLGGRHIEIGDFAQAARFGIVSRIGASESSYDVDEAVRKVVSSVEMTKVELDSSWYVSNRRAA